MMACDEVGSGVSWVVLGGSVYRMLWSGTGWMAGSWVDLGVVCLFRHVVGDSWGWIDHCRDGVGVSGDVMVLGA